MHYIQQPRHKHSLYVCIFICHLLTANALFSCSYLFQIAHHHRRQPHHHHRKQQQLNLPQPVSNKFTPPSALPYISFFTLQIWPISFSLSLVVNCVLHRTWMSLFTFHICVPLYHFALWFPFVPGLYVVASLERISSNSSSICLFSTWIIISFYFFPFFWCS